MAVWQQLLELDERNESLLWAAAVSSVAMLCLVLLPILVTRLPSDLLIRPTR